MKVASVVATSILVLSAYVVSAQDPSGPAVPIIEQIKRADYEGDRDALRRHHQSLVAVPTPADRRLASRILYWRGFALWRRGFNGLAQSAPVADIQADLTAALAEFDAAIAVDPGFVDAKAGAISCIGNIVYFRTQAKESVQPLLARVGPLIQESRAAMPDNPRLLWVLAAQQMQTPVDLGGGRDRAIATYRDGLAAARAQAGRQSDVLEPSWGLPELLMSMANVSMAAAPPDRAAAKNYADQALALVPYWRALREGVIARLQSQ